MILRTLKPEELHAWANLCDSQFGVGAQYFIRHFENDPFADPNAIFVFEEEGRLVASVRVFRREIYLSGQRVATGGIGEVCTHVDFRRQGLSGRLLRRAIEYMNAQGWPLSLLFTGNFGHYARYGWFRVPEETVRVALEHALPKGIIARPLEGRDWPAARGLHALSAGRWDGVLVREHPYYWEKWVTAELRAPLGLFQEEELLLWLDAEEEDGAARLREVSLMPGCDALILPGLTAFAQARGLKCGVLPTALVPGVSGEHSNDGSAMLRVNTPFDLAGRRIDSPEALLRVVPEFTFWSADDF